MSTAIDNRVVQMEFDNQRFEKNVATSISTLDKLKAALKLDGATKGLERVEQTVRGLDLSRLSYAVDNIANKFSIMGIIGVTALTNIANKAIDTGIQLVKSMSVDQVMSGWNKYADKTSAVQTIMAATRDTWDEYSQKIGYAGDQMDYVNDQMSKLNWFTDETSYNFVDMVSNIGKFTANEIPLDQAVTAMQGIATWTAVSGQNAAAASRVMYNLSQSIATGSVKLQDFMSLENANVATAAFKNKVLEIAEANGQLQREADGVLYAIDDKGKKVAVNLQNFRTTLSAGWFDKDTLISVLEEYGNFTNELYEFSEATGLCASEILGLTEAQQEGTLSAEELQKIADDSGLSIEDLTARLESLNSEENKFGQEAFRAAQEAKTFQEAVDSVKDAASTKWMNIFENIFGDYEKARHVWTDFAEFLYDILITPLEKVEEFSEMFKELNGLDRLVEVFGNIFAYLGNGNDNTYGIFKSIKEGFESVFPPMELTIGKMAIFFRNLKEWSESLELTEEQSNKLKTAATGLANVLKYAANSIKNIWAATEPLRTSFSKLFTSIGNLVLRIFGLASDMNTAGVEGDGLRKICDKLAEIIDKVTTAVEGLEDSDLTTFFEKLKTIAEGLGKALEFVANTVINFWNDAQPLISAVGNLATAIGDLIVQVFDLGGDLDDAGIHSETFKTICEKLAEIINTVADAISNVDISGLSVDFSIFSTIVDALVKGLKWVGEKTKGVVDGIIESFNRLKENLASGDFASAITTILGGIGVAVAGIQVYFITSALQAFHRLKDFMTEIMDLAWSFNEKNLADALKNLAIAIGILAVSLLVLSFVDYEKAAIGILMIATVLIIMYAALDSVAKSLKPGELAKMAVLAGTLIVVSAAFLIFSASLIVLAAALAAFALVAKMDTIAEGLLLMAATIAIVAVAMGVLGSLGPVVLAGAAAMLIFSVALLILAAAMGAFALVAMLDSAWEGLGFMAASLAVLTIQAAILGALSPLIAAAGAALMVLAKALIVLAVAVGAFALVAMLDSVWVGLGLMAASLAILAVELTVIGALSPLILAGSIALMALSVALGLLAVAIAGFAAVAMLDSVWAGLGLMAASLAILAVELTVIGALSPLILFGSIALMALGKALVVLAAAIAAFAGAANIDGVWAGLGLMAAALAVLGLELIALGALSPVILAAAVAIVALGAACMVLAAALGLLGLLLPVFSAGLAALAVAIGMALTAIGQGVQDFLVSLSDALVAVGDALAEIITTIAGSLGEAVSLLGEGIAEAITGIIASVGEGIGRGITAISDAIGTFGDNLSKSALGVESLGDSVRSLQGIDWLGAAAGVAELAFAFKKLNKFEGVTEAITAMLTEVNGMASNLQTAGDNLGNSFIAGLNGKISVARTSGTALASNAGSGVSSSPSWYSIGANYGQGFVNGVSAKWGAAYAAGYSLGLAAKQGMEDAGEIASPSKVARKLGGFFGIGWAKGILDKVSDSEDAGREMVDRTIDIMARANGLVNDILSNDLQPRISPVLDLSNVRNGLINLDQSMALAKDRLSTEVISKINMGMVGLSGVAPVSSGSVYNISIDGIKYNADDYVDSSIQNFVETMVRKNKMYTGR